MKYLILSDIHGSLPSLQQALTFFDQQACDMLLLLGDLLNYGPRNGLPDGLDAPGVAALLNRYADKIVAVRGNCDSEVDQMLLHFPILADYALVTDEGKKLLLTHGHLYHEQQLPPGNFHAVFTGHTHLWHLRHHNQTLCCNTGSITFPKEGNPPTMAVYEKGTIMVYHLNGTPLEQKSIVTE